MLPYKVPQETFIQIEISLSTFSKNEPNCLQIKRSKRKTSPQQIN